MSFLHPLGLLGLLGIPLLIIIYIIKNKHTEQIVSSTYLWTLSEKFLKKRKKVSPLSGLISLILQIFIVLSISLLIAHPIFTVKNSAKDYCFIVDGSGSMNMEIDGQTRMQIGLNKIEEIIMSSSDGSKYSLVYVGETTRVVYEKLANKEKAVELLNKLKPAGLTENYTTTLKQVQEYFNDNNSLVTYLITDKEYTSKNIEVINVSNHEKNYAIATCDYHIKEEKLVINGSVMSYENDELINLEIYVNNELMTTLQIETKKLIESQFTYEVDALEFEEIKISILNDDGLMLDNVYKIYNIDKENEYTTLIISNKPFYLQSMLQVVANTTAYIISPENYHPSMDGYDLYIFDSYAPNVLPSDGTVWFFGANKSIDGAGFSVQDTVEDVGGIELSYPRNSTSIFKLLTDGLSKDEIYVTKYVKYGLHRNFTTILTHDGNPIVFTGISDYGNREVVFAFDLHDSNFPLLVDYLVLSKNLIEYSFPIMFEKSTYVCGDTMEINVLSNCNSIRVESPLGNVSYLDVSTEMTELKLTEAGTYKLKMMFGETEKVFNVYSSLPIEESSPVTEIVELSLQGEQQNEYLDGIYDKLIIFFILLLIVYVLDWGVYCYEQYQLR